jgi:uncharacterized protein (DUF1778 family)
MAALTERLEIRLSRSTYRLLQEEAQRRGVPVADLVRRGIDLLLREDRLGRLAAADALFDLQAPVADWEKMKRQIARSHTAEDLEPDLR